MTTGRYIFFFGLLGAIAFASAVSAGVIPTHVKKTSATTLHVAAEGTTYTDGKADSPHAKAQLPTLLSSYKSRPPWNVAGVDYAVGYPPQTALADWTRIPQSGTITVQRGKGGKPGAVIVSRTSGKIFDSIDFSLHEGARLFFTNQSHDGVVRNSKFSSPYNTALINADLTSSGLTVLNCFLDGLGSGGEMFPGQQGSLITANGGGDIVVRYNWLRNTNMHVLELAGDANLELRFNLIENRRGSVQSHGNFLQWGGARAKQRALVEFNTTYQENAPGAGEGFQFYNNASQSSFHGISFSHNTMIAHGPRSMSYMLHGSSGRQYPTSLAGPASVHDNYFDASGAYGVFYPGTWSRWNIKDNRDMVTGRNVGAPP